MVSLSELSNASKGLKRTKVEEKPQVVQSMICEGKEDYEKLMLETYLENYVDGLGDLTFRTKFIPLSYVQVTALKNGYEHKMKTGESQFNDVLERLADNVENAKKELGCDKVFVRLSSRSPKDASLADYQRFKDEIDKQMTLLNEDERRLNIENQVLSAAYRTTVQMTGASHGQAAIELLLSSKRIQGDLDMVIEATNDNEDGSKEEEDSNKSQKLVVGKDKIYLGVREFIEFDPTLECRGFVYKNKITAITQYNNFIVSPYLLKNRAFLSDRFKRFFEEELIFKLKDLNIDSCVLDLMILPNENGCDIKVIELNPLAEFAGTGLFSWEKDRDLLLGKKEFEFAIVEEPISFVYNIVNVDFVNILKKAGYIDNSAVRSN